jgi:hypothetical protein
MTAEKEFQKLIDKLALSADGIAGQMHLITYRDDH